MAAGCVWGIDIGKSSLKAVRMREGKEEVEILAVVHLEYELDEEGVIPPSEASAAVEELLRRHPEIKKDRVLVALPGQQSFSRFIKLPGFAEGRVDEMVSFEAQQQIPFPIDEVVWDYDLVEDEDGSGDEQEVGLFAIKKELVYAFLGDLRLSGLEPDGLTIGPLATYNFVRFDCEYDQTKVLVVLDIGWDHTDLLIIDGERYWMRNLALSGQELTKAIATKLKKSFEQAEDLKRESAAAGETDARKVYQATQLVLKDFVSEIHRSIGFYKAQNKGRKIDIGEILLLGNGSKLASIRPFFQRELGYPVKLAKRLSELTLDEDLGSEEVDLLKEQLPTLAVAFGLGVQGAGWGFNEINLLPQEMQLQKALQKKKIPIAMAVALLFVAVVLSYMRASASLTETEQVLKQASVNLNELRDNASTIEELRNVSAIEADLEALQGIAAGRNYPLEVLNQIAASLPQANGELTPLTPEEQKELQLSGRKKPVIDRVEQQLRARMEALNKKKLWLLELDLQEVWYAVGTVPPGSQISTADGQSVAKDKQGRFRHLVELAPERQAELLQDPLHKRVKLAVTGPDGFRQERDYPLRAGVQARLTVAKVLQGDEKDALEAIQRDVLDALAARLPDASFDGVAGKVYALELGAATPPQSGGFGQEATVFQTFITHDLVVSYPSLDEMLGGEAGAGSGQ